MRQRRRGDIADAAVKQVGLGCGAAARRMWRTLRRLPARDNVTAEDGDTV
jgi:hypothetical protein